MARVVEITVPDIGEFEDVEVVELIASPGDAVERDASLISLESDKATLEIPSPVTGVLRELTVALGDRVSEGAVIARIEVPSEAEDDTASAQLGSDVTVPTAEPSAESPVPASARSASDSHAEVLVLGGGPGGYSAAFRAADLGKQVVLVERHSTLGGVCLNVGCIPSKALLHVAERITDVQELRNYGVDFGEMRIDLARLRERVDEIVASLTRGLASLAKRRGVQVVQGSGRFSAVDQLTVETAEGAAAWSFDSCIVAAGSRTIELPGVPSDDARVMDSTAALRLDDVPQRLLIIGGGIIGLEMATVYHGLGSRVSVVELLDGLVPGCDRDLVGPLQAAIQPRYENIWLGTRVVRLEARADALEVFFEGPDAPESQEFDRVLVAVGRRPNADQLDTHKAGLELDSRGFIPVDAKLRTNVPGIYAIGDITGPPLLAHRASHQGRTAAEVIAGLPASFDALTIPAVAYTDPEIAWMGLTEEEARVHGTRFDKAVFPWSASGRALGAGAADGATKILVDPETRRLLGVGMVGRGAGELIAGAVVALEMGADAQDLALSVHPHPTLSETLALAAEMVEGTITDLYAPR